MTNTKYMQISIAKESKDYDFYLSYVIRVYVFHFRIIKKEEKHY